MPSALCTLPDELLIHIAEYLQREDTALRSLARTSRRFQAIAEPVLYRSIFFRTGTQLSRLQHVLGSVPWRMKSLRSLDARCTRDPAGSGVSELDALGQLLRAAPSIENLTIESPYCNNSAWVEATTGSRWSQTMESWLGPLIQAAAPNTAPLSVRPLQVLKILTLHLKGTSREFWTMNGAFAWILAHPTLEDLHLSSINIPRDTTAALNPRPRTPLKRLTLDEANVTLDGLRGVMSIPIALEYLYIGENRYSPIEQAHPPGEKYNRLATRDAQAFIDIISLQKHSLETFTYICNESTLSPRVPWTHIRQETDLSMFEVLRELSISGCNHSYMMTWCARCKAPPRLQRLTVDELVYIDVVINEDLPPDEPPIFIKEVMAATPHLKQLDMIGTSDDFDLSAPWMVRPREATAVDGQYLAQKGCTFQVLRPPSRTGIVRPVLYGEREPENVLMYVNDQQGFRVANMDDWLPPEDETSEDDDFAFGDVLGGAGDEEEDDEEETSEEEDVDDDDEE